MRLEQKPPVVTGEPGNWQIDEEALAGLFEEADRNSKYIEAHFEELLQQYPDRWIGVFQGQVVANSKSSRGLVEKLRAMDCLKKGAATRYMDTNPQVWII